MSRVKLLGWATLLAGGALTVAVTFGLLFGSPWGTVASGVWWAAILSLFSWRKRRRAASADGS